MENNDILAFFKGIDNNRDLEQKVKEIQEKKPDYNMRADESYN
jgi:hypothetical protein